MDNFSDFSMKVFAYAGAHIVSIAQPFFEDS